MDVHENWLPICWPRRWLADCDQPEPHIMVPYDYERVSLYLFTGHLICMVEWIFADGIEIPTLVGWFGHGDGDSHETHRFGHLYIMDYPARDISTAITIDGKIVGDPRDFYPRRVFFSPALDGQE